MLNPGPPAAVIAGNTEVSQATCNALSGRTGGDGREPGHDEQFHLGQRRLTRTTRPSPAAPARGRGSTAPIAVQSHMTNTRMTDPEVLEKRFPVRLEAFRIRHGSGGAGRWHGGCGVVRRVRFLAPVTVTTLSLSRIVPPFGLHGGAAGALGENVAEGPDGRREKMGGNAEVELPAGGVFEMRTPGGGGWGTLED